MIQNPSLGPAALQAVGRLTLRGRMRKERPLGWAEVGTVGSSPNPSGQSTLRIPGPMHASLFTLGEHFSQELLGDGKRILVLEPQT